MRPEEWARFLEERIEARLQFCARLRVQPKGSDLCATFVGRSARGIGVRPTKVAENPDGTNVYVLTLDQALRALEKAHPHASHKPEERYEFPRAGAEGADGGRASDPPSSDSARTRG